MLFRNWRQNFWQKRGIKSVDQDQNLQGLHRRIRREGDEAPNPEAGATPWSTLRDTPPSQKEDQQ